MGAAPAFPFDWILTTDRGIVEWIAGDLDGFFAREHFGRGRDDCVIDVRNETQYQHEFPKGADFDAQFALHAPKYAMLTVRWRELMGSDRSVLFVRQHAWDADARACAVRLRETLRARAPRLSFALLYLIEPKRYDGPWHEAQIENAALPQPASGRWEGDDAVWERLLGSALHSAAA